MPGAPSEPPAPHDVMDALDTVLMLDDMWNAAYHHRDPGRMAGVLADDWMAFFPGGEVIFNFGKYKGQRVEEVFTKNPSHYDWMMKGDFSLHTKQKISEILNSMKLAKLKG